MQISFDINKITSFEDASAPFILYNSTRYESRAIKSTSRDLFSLVVCVLQSVLCAAQVRHGRCFWPVPRGT
jgi:hypothetical protein